MDTYRYQRRNSTESIETQKEAVQEGRKPPRAIHFEEAKAVKARNILSTVFAGRKKEPVQEDLDPGGYVIREVAARPGR